MVRPATAVEGREFDVSLRTRFDRVATAVGTRRSLADALALIDNYNRTAGGKSSDELHGFPQELALDPQVVFEEQ